MCGIVGVLDLRGTPVESSWIESMNGSIIHRGPDDSGSYVNGPVGIGMRRLAIIDVNGGHQPVHNEDRTIWAVFNGEIYNHRELRRELETAGHRFYTNSDSETLVHVYEQFGVEGVSRLRGMFAYALWDETRQRLLLARDRIGIKPLYYSFRKGRLIFASELKALLQVPWFEPEINPSAVQDFLAYLYVPGPDTIYRDVHELEPAHILVQERERTTIRRYWTLRYQPDSSVSGAEWEERFLHQFQNSVESHLISEVPLGAFLSGGVDSSAIVAAMARASSKPVLTFSIGHEGKGAFQDERAYARIVADRFHTEHHEFVVTTDIKDILPKLITCFDQPFADSSAIPNYYISQLTRQHVTVALSGLGGDEIGGGYERYLGMKLAEVFRMLPGPIRAVCGEKWIQGLPDHAGGRPGMSRLKRFFASAEKPPAERYAAFVTTFSPEARGRLLASDFLSGAKPGNPEDRIAEVFRSGNAEGLLHNLLLCDMQLYLPGDLLALTDRVSMHHSLEVRVPFLDHPLIELMAQVPDRFKVSMWSKKILFRKAFKGFLPDSILDRKKLGFSVPMGLWLREELNPLMREVLSEANLREIGYLNVKEVDRVIRTHTRGAANCEGQLWGLINLVLWHQSMLRAGRVGAR